MRRPSPLLPTFLIITALGIGCDKKTPPVSPPPASKPATAAPKPTLAPQNEAAVRAVFDIYQTAILNDRGEDAVNSVSQDTIDWYESVRVMALTAPEDELRRQGLMNRMQVVLLRHRIPVAELDAMDGRALFIHAVEQGWVGKNSVSDVAIGPITINENFAKGPLIAQGKTSPIHFQFKGENGAWKLDLLYTMKVAVPALSAQAKGMDLDENEFILRTAEVLSGRQVPDTIWKPSK